ncbi:hypothetical protein [Pseudoalteromonas piratica]|uniref:Uncharacterized protein n=1 Tax=Pseudoalteromonas piratica TaxID=1348114 RepID=A0A0A7EGW9_9GAMM|nr:hypothetical protein [Pseudoalteromonas piratica]AIY65217.1 hypothetical protein OM33_08620 [Pseudoalteromonas piratica]
MKRVNGFFSNKSNRFFLFVISLVFISGLLTGFSINFDIFNFQFEQGEKFKIVLSLFVFGLSLITLWLNKKVTDSRTKKEKLTDKAELLLYHNNIIRNEFRLIGKKETPDDYRENINEVFGSLNYLRVITKLYFNDIELLEQINTLSELVMNYNGLRIDNYHKKQLKSDNNGPENIDHDYSVIELRGDISIAQKVLDHKINKIASKYGLFNL